MSRSAFALLGQRRFIWLFVCQFAGAANDNLFKNAMAILLVYRLGAAGGLSPQVLVSLAAGVFILPFFLFSAMAGLFADRWEKTGLIRLIKLAEIPITLLGTAALILGSTGLLMATLFLLGVQAAFFGPLKYAILPELLAEDEVVAGNALVEAATFIAILLGTIAGGLLILRSGGEATVSALMIGLAILGFVSSLRVPHSRPGQRALALTGGIFGETRAVIAGLKANPPLRHAVLGISWFWLVGATFLAQFPAFAKDTLYADEQVVTLMLTMFSLGIGVGSLLCARLLKGRLSTRPVPWAALGIAIFSADLAFAGAVGQPSALAGIGAFATSAPGLRVLLDLALAATCGGIYVVPLYTTLQMKADEHARARAVAANNILNAAFMVASALLGAGLLGLGATVGQVFLTIAALTLFTGLLLRRMPSA